MSTPIEFVQLGGRLTMMWEPVPTGVFQSEEATKIVAQMESILREQIAKEVEALKCNHEMLEEECVIENNAFDEAAFEIRGLVE